MCRSVHCSIKSCWITSLFKKWPLTACFRNQNHFQLQFYPSVTPAVSQICYLYNIAVIPSMRIQDQGNCFQYDITQRRWCFLFYEPVKLDLILRIIFHFPRNIFYALASTQLGQAAFPTVKKKKCFYLNPVFQFPRLAWHRPSQLLLLHLRHLEGYNILKKSSDAVTFCISYTVVNHSKDIYSQKRSTTTCLLPTRQNTP